jgi:hypothetical protein
MNSVQKVDDISYDEFYKAFYKPGIPVVFKNASKTWKARDLFTPSYFRENFGERRTTVKGKEYTINEILELIEHSSSENPAPYPCKFNIHRQLPELLPLIKPMGMHYAVPNWFHRKIFPTTGVGSSTELFFGGAGGKFPNVHLDFFHTNAWVTQLYGNKNFIVFPRGQDELLYPNEDNPYISRVDIFNPDYEKFPKYRDATPIVVTVEQGESIFIPWGIWHSSEPLEPSISVIFDQMNRDNYKYWLKDVWDEKKRGNKVMAISYMSFVLFAKAYCEFGDILNKMNSD